MRSWCWVHHTWFRLGPFCGTCLSSILSSYYLFVCVFWSIHWVFDVSSISRFDKNIWSRIIRTKLPYMGLENFIFLHPPTLYFHCYFETILCDSDMVHMLTCYELLYTTDALWMVIVQGQPSQEDTCNHLSMTLASR